MSQKFLSSVALTGISSGSILKVNSSGVIVAAVDGTDYNTGGSQWTTSGNNIYYTTGNVGIGTTSPDTTLHVQNSGTGAVVKLTNASNSFYLGNDSNGGYLQPASTGMAIYGPNGSKYVFVNNTGVGIGETSPDGLLHIKGSAQATEFYIESSTGTASTSGAIKIAQNNRSAEDFAGEMVFYVQDTNVGGVYWREAMAIINNGNVGIGNSSPGNNRLKVTGATEITGNLTLSGLGAGFLKTDANGAVSVDTSTYLTSYTETDTLDSVTDRGATTTNAIGTGNLTINSSSSAASYIYLLSSTTGESELRMGDTDTDAGSIAYNNNLDRMAFRTNAAERVYIDSSGNVGIGVSSPAQRLDVLGKMKITDDIILAQINGRIDYDNGNEGGALRFWSTSAASERMRITSAGNVGIGTTSPQTELHVKGNNGWGEVRIEGQTFASGHGASLEFYSEGTALADIYASTDKHLYFRTNGTTERMRITSAGNVGIGTTSPESLLHLSKSSVGGDGAFLFIDNPASSTLGNTAGIRFATNTGASFSGYGSFIQAVNTNAGNGAESLTFGTWDGASRGERMRILHNGNVGIGTTSTSAKLAIKNGSNADLEFFSESSGTALQSFNRTTSTWGYLRFLAGGGEKMRIHTDGKVGIGVTSPSTLLHVNGTITAPGITTTNNATVLDNTGIQPAQGTTEKTVVFKWSGTEIASLNNEGYFTASGYKTGGTTGYLKSDGTVDTSTFISSIPAEYVTESELSTTLGGYITVSAFNSATVFVLNGTDVGMGDNVTLGTAAFSASTDFVAVSGDTMTGQLLMSDATGTTGIYITSDTTSGNGSVIRINKSSSARQAYQSFESDQLYLGVPASNTTLGEIGTKGSVDLRFATGYSERMRITSAGNVGIGTTSPGSKLEVQGTIAATGGIISQSTSYPSSANIWGISNDYPATAWGIRYVEGSPDEIRIIGNSITNHRFGMDVGNAYLAINSGNVGIGTTSPDAKFDVRGTAKFRGAYNGVTISPTATGADMYFYEANAPKIYIQSNDVVVFNTGYNFGIGTTTPSYPFTVSSSTTQPIAYFGLGPTNASSRNSLVILQSGTIPQSGSDTTGEAGFLFKHSYGTGGVNGTANGGYIESIRESVFGITSQVNTALVFGTSASNTDNERMRITSTGNVGIGTTSPSYKLHVSGSFSCTTMNISEDITTSAGNVVLANDAGIYSLKTGTVTAGNSSTAFRVSNTDDVQAARVTFVVESTNFQVAKIYEVVKAGTNDPVAFKVVDTGPSGEEDFSVAFSNDGGDLLCTVTNDSSAESMVVVSTIFLGGSISSQTVSAS